MCRSPDDGEGCRPADRRGVLDHRRPRPQKGSGTPLHRYWEADEAFYVLNGELTFYLGMEKIGVACKAYEIDGVGPAPEADARLRPDSTAEGISPSD